MGYQHDYRRPFRGTDHCPEQYYQSKKTEEKLQENEERYDLALRFSNDGLFDWALESSDVYYSPDWKRILGYEYHEIQNHFSEWERLTAPEDRKSAMRMVKEVIQGDRERLEAERQMRHKNGVWKNILSRGNLIYDENGKAIRMVGTHVDITHRKQMESQLRQAKKWNP